MIKKYYEVLGADESFSDEALKERYLSLKNKYQEERFLEGEAGNNAAKMLTEIEIAYNEIVSFRNETVVKGKTTESFASVESAIKSGNLSLAQQLLDEFNERDGEWHYYQSVIFYKKNWINESKKQLEIALTIEPNNQKYKTALNKLNQKVNEGSKINPDWNKSTSGGSQTAYHETEQQLGGDSCAQWCCDMIICNTILNCCCSCR